MDGMFLGMAMLVSSSAGVPAVDTPRAAPSAFTFTLPDAAATPLREEPRPVWQSASSARAQTTTAKRLHPVLRGMVIGAGAGAGFLAGARVGWEVTPKRGPYDDTSGLKGVMIGAPIGAVLGAVLGWQLTK
jgi:hypothetical protein